MRYVTVLGSRVQSVANDYILCSFSFDELAFEVNIVNAAILMNEVVWRWRRSCVREGLEINTS